MPYTLAFQDRFRRVIENVFTRDSSGVVPFASIPDDVPTIIRYEWTGKQFTKLLSSVMVGADLAFPEQADDIIFDLIKGVHGTLELEPDGDCLEYSPSAPFITYHPDSPFIEGDKGFGWHRDAWFQWADFFDIWPDWIADWLPGFVGSFTGYENTDVLCNIAALGYVSWLAFLDDGGVFPKIEIRFTGSGVIELELLSFPLGGKAVIELDEEPNILDILTGGIIDPNAFMVELNRDILSFPPDEIPIVNVEVPVETGGEHVLYICFIPIVNDEATFLGFGGGLRSVEKCGFEEEATMGIEQVIWDGCALKTVISGVETTVVTAEQIQACMDIPDPGEGGGNAAFKASNHKIELSSNKTTTSAGYVDIAEATLNYGNEFPNVLVIVKNLNISGSGTAISADVRILLAGNPGFDANEQSTLGNVRTPMQISDHWENLASDLHTIKIQWRTGGAGTITLAAGQTIDITIIEYGDISQLFVEDVRYLDGVLQKKIGGVWFDVVDIEALLAPIQATAAAAATAAANAQTTANNAVTVNSAQQVVLNNHESRIDSIEDIDIPQINLMLSDHESRIDVLEAAGDSLTWGGYPLGSRTDFALSPGATYSSPFSSFDTNGADAGWVPTANYDLDVFIANANRLGACVFVRISCTQLAGYAGMTSAQVNGGGYHDLILNTGSENRMSAWIPVPPSESPNMHIEIKNDSNNANWRYVQMTFLFLNYNPFTLDVLT